MWVDWNQLQSNQGIGINQIEERDYLTLRWGCTDAGP